MDDIAITNLLNTLSIEETEQRRHDLMEMLTDEEADDFFAFINDAPIGADLDALLESHVAELRGS